MERTRAVSFTKYEAGTAEGGGGRVRVTFANIWRHAVATFSLDRDAHASSLNAVLPAYDSDLPASLNSLNARRRGPGVGRALLAQSGLRRALRRHP